MKYVNEKTSRIVEMAWEDRTPFEAIEVQYGISEQGVIDLMRKQLRAGSFKRWRQRVSGRKTKHRGIRNPAVSRAHCATQYKIKGQKSVKSRRR